jgi:Mn2+/Fe2+ NRAMP family transporter
MASTLGPSSPRRGLLGSLGPAIIVASVVLGPGSILANSRIGAEHGYRLVWVLALSCGLMMGMVALGARLGIGLERTPCAELARRLGRPVAVIIGVTVFLIITCFQVGNNTAVIAAFSPGSSSGAGNSPAGWNILALLALNGLTVASLYGFRKLYQSVERLMMAMVLIMIVGFAANLVLARPDLLAAVCSFVPRLPEGFSGAVMPLREDTTVVDPLGSVPALVATTMSVAGAFYQAYLVREKRWSPLQLRQGTVDALVGILVLGGISLMILLTAAAQFHGRIAPTDLRTTSDVARQLQPLFGSFATLLFNAGLFAAAFSSFLVNALIGGAVLADALGLDSSMGNPWPKAFTTLALLLSMGLAIAFSAFNANPVALVLFAQALTVLGLPALALSMLFLGTRVELRRSGLTSPTLLIIASVCFALSLILALRKAWELWLKLT